MESIFYQNTTYWVILVDVIAALGTLWLFYTGKAKKSTLLTVGLVFTASILLMYWIFGGQNLLHGDLPGWNFYLLILGGALGIVALLEITSKSVMKNLSQEHIQLVQGLRVFVGGGFLMEGVVKVIPGWFSILDGYFHIASGFLALVAAVAFLKKWKETKPLLWIANVVGLTDIIIIVTGICFWVWGDLGPFHNMNYVVFGAGPVLLWLHYNSIKKLLNK